MVYTYQQKGHYRSINEHIWDLASQVGKGQVSMPEATTALHNTVALMNDKEKVEFKNSARKIAETMRQIGEAFTQEITVLATRS